MITTGAHDEKINKMMFAAEEIAQGAGSSSAGIGAFSCVLDDARVARVKIVEDNVGS